jgi:hypothetical protein
MSDAKSDFTILTTSGWKATPWIYSSLRVLSFRPDQLGTLTYGYGQTIYAIIECRWRIPDVGLIELNYLESPPRQAFRGFIPNEKNRLQQFPFGWRTKPLVPTLCVGMPSRPLCGPKDDAERRRGHSHGDRGNEIGTSPRAGFERG